MGCWMGEVEDVDVVSLLRQGKGFRLGLGGSLWTIWALELVVRKGVEGRV